MTCLARGLTQTFRRSDRYVFLVLSRRSIERSCAAGLRYLQTWSSKPRMSNDSFSTLMCGFQESGSALDSKEANNEKAVKEATSKLLNFGITENDLAKNPEVWTLSPTVIDHRLQYCAEGGLHNCIECVTKFDYLTATSVSALKSSGVLPPEVTVPEKMLSDMHFMGQPPPPMSENLSYKEIHWQTVCHYMTECFGFSYKYRKPHIHGSLKMTVDNIITLRKAKLPWRWIKSHPSIICFAYPPNLSKLFLLENFELPVSVQRLVSIDKNIAFVNADDVLAIFFILMSHGVCKHHIKQADFRLFLINPDLLDQLLRKLKNTSPPEDANYISLLYELNYLTCNRKSFFSRVPSQILRQEDLLDIKVEVTSPGDWRNKMKLWFNSEKRSCLVYEHHCHHRRRTNTRTDRILALFSRTFDVSVESVRAELSRIPLWFRVAPEVVQETIEFLLSEGFKQKEIIETMQLLLYPRCVVQETLEQCVEKDPVYGSEAYRERHLQLCLYFILKRFNYSLGLETNDKSS